jgi:hypothetical protein
MCHRGTEARRRRGWRIEGGGWRTARARSGDGVLGDRREDGTSNIQHRTSNVQVNAGDQRSQAFGGEADGLGDSVGKFSRGLVGQVRKRSGGAAAMMRVVGMAK